MGRCGWRSAVAWTPPPTTSWMRSRSCPAEPTGLIELKARGGDLAKGTLQLVAYVQRFRDLARQWPAWASKGLHAVLLQKMTLRLLPPTEITPLDTVIPVLASADDRSDWAHAWRDTIRVVRTSHASELEGLALWRLGDQGDILETVLA
jgi:hypothetical protein